MKKAVQQLMLGTLTENLTKTESVLKKIKDIGYDQIELNGFMIRKSPFLVKLLTRMAGMPVGNSGKYDWEYLIDNSGLKVSSVHEDLGTIERDVKGVINEAHKFNTENIVITGMYRFDYRDYDLVMSLTERLNTAGKLLREDGINLLYHNHNIEWVKCDGITAYERIVKNTDPEYLNFEFDSYWPTEAGVDAAAEMEGLGARIKLYHINDRGTRLKRCPMTPILKSDCVELGNGNMPLKKLINIAKNAGAETVILETHKNFVDNDPLKSIEMSFEFLKENA